MSATLCVPLAQPRPDIGRFLRAVTSDYQPPRAPLVEYIVDEAKRRAVVEAVGRAWVGPGGDRASQRAYWDNFTAFWHHLGYDFVRLEMALPWPGPARPGGQDGRHFAETARGPIGTWADFEAYPWPDPAAMDYFPWEHIATHLPEGMGLLANHAGGPLELLTRLMGYEPLCVALYEQPDLVAAVASRVGESMRAVYRHLLDLPNLAAVFPGDDMGFRSGTLLSPEHLRTYTLPWHRAFASMAHRRGVPYFLHSCGQLRQIMPDLLDDVRIDAKHSYEDAILPAAQAKGLWGGRIGILGGVDVDVLARRSPQQVRRYVRGVIEACAPGGRFAVGSGNSIPDYVPLENYLTMLDEALR